MEILALSGFVGFDIYDIYIHKISSSRLWHTKIVRFSRPVRLSGVLELVLYPGS